MHTYACEKPLIVIEPPVQGQRRAGASDREVHEATPRAGAMEWPSVIGTGIVFLSGAMALIGSLVHYLR
jgi:fructose-bisphosphate aldolase class 1